MRAHLVFDVIVAAVDLSQVQSQTLRRSRPNRRGGFTPLSVPRRVKRTPRLVGERRVESPAGLRT